MELEKLIFRGVFRRHKETGKLVIVTMFAVFFMAAILLLQKNIFSFQMQNSKETFGDWIMKEYTSNGVSEAVLDHPYISGFGENKILGDLYDGNYSTTDQKIGCFDAEFIRRGNISLYKGTLPSEDNEIAIDLNTLTQLGYNIDLGQTIEVYYIDKSANASSRAPDNKLKKEYILTGIFHSYRTLWNGGDTIPGLIISEDAFNEYGFQQASNYIYSLKSNIKTDDYSLVYKGLKEIVTGSTTYNKNVYDNKLWDSDTTYNLVLTLIMGLGLISITFQMISYSGKRKPYYYKLRGMGASMNQIRKIIALECLSCTIFAAAVGMILSIAVGWGICILISKRSGISQFFSIDISFLTQVMSLTLLILFVSVIIVQILSARNKITENSFELTSRKLHIIKHMKLKRGNVVRQFISRRINTRIIQSVFSRILITGVCLMLIICVDKICIPYSEYRESLKIPDFEGILLEKPLTFPYSVDYVNEKTDSDGNTKLEEINGFSSVLGVMNGRSNTVIGFDELFQNTLDNESGISSIKYMNMESTRSFIQNNKNGYNAFCQKIFNTKTQRDSITKDGDNNKQYYLYVSQYNTVNEAQYNNFRKDIPENLFNYEDYKSGKQVILFLNSYDFGNGEEYDSQINPGDTLHYSFLLHTCNARNLPYYGQLEKAEKNLKSASNHMNEEMKKFLDIQEKLFSNSGACATPTVATVIKLTPENKEYYKTLLPQQGIYTVLASEQFGRSLVENEYNTLSEVVDSPDCTYKYNQIEIMLDLNSEYEGTANIISQLFSKYGVSYTGHFEEKQLARQNLLNAFLLYGTAFFSILMVFLVIKSNMHQSELDNQKRRFILLQNLGADKKTVLSIIIVGFLRENIWAFLAIAISVYIMKLAVPLVVCILISLIVFVMLLIIETIISLLYINSDLFVSKRQK